MSVFYCSFEETSHSSDNESTDSEDDTPLAAENRKMWNLINLSSSTKSDTPASKVAEVACQCNDTEKNLKRGVFKDVSVKVESDVYELDRVALALKSDYFEKLFITNFVKDESNLLEMHTIDSDTFSTIVDIMYTCEDDLETYVNMENFAALLLAMDYLQMEIDLKVFREFLIKNLKLPSLLHSGGFKLLSSIADNPNFEYLLPTIYQYFSIHFIDILLFEDFFLLPINALVKIITRNRFPRYTTERRKISLICTEWIGKDIENRLIHMADLVNAAKYRYGFHFGLDGQSMNAQFLLDIDKPLKRKKEMERYFQNLLYQNGQIDPAERDLKELNPNAQVYSIINKIDEEAKWTSFLENKYFCDITVKVGEKKYALHRWKLESSTDYFDKDNEDGESPKTLDTDVDFEFENIDALTFEAIIEYMYFSRIDFESNVVVYDLLRASEFLDIEDLAFLCKTQITLYVNANNPRIWDEFIKILNFIVGKDEYKDLCILFREHIVSTWPKIGTLPEFGTISHITLESILMLDKLEINHPDEILDICSKWIAHDAQNRYHLLPRIANTISHNHQINRCGPVENPADWNDCSEEFIKNKLWEILYSVSSVTSDNSLQNKPGSAQQPAFIAPLRGNDGLFDVIDLEFNKITTVHSFYSTCCERLSAALIKDNLFVLFKVKKKFSFQVYNLTTKKFFSLALFHRLIKVDDQQLTLLNCNDELYCCCEKGAILKYVFGLNRWIFIVKTVTGRERILHASNGNTLYRLSRQTQTRISSFIAEAYDFQQNLYIPLPELPSRINRLFFSRVAPISLTAVNNNLAILFASDIVFFDHQRQSWYDVEIGISDAFGRGREFGASILTQRQGKVVCMRDKKIWYVSLDDGKSTSDQKTLPDKYFSSIVAVHYVQE